MHILHVDFVLYETSGKVKKTTSLFAFLLPVRQKKMPYGRGVSSGFLNIFVNITIPPFIRHEWHLNLQNCILYIINCIYERA